MISVSVATGALGYVLITAAKGKTNPILIVPLVALVLIVLFCNLPGQIKRVDE
jgi:hypothetical protein